MGVFKELYYSNVTFVTHIDDYEDGTYVQSESAQVFGGAIIVGKQYHFVNHSFFEIFGGIGFGNLERNYTVYEYYSSRAPNYNIQSKLGTFNEKKNIAIAQLGFKISFNIHEKK